MNGHQFKAHGKLGLKIGIPTIDPEFWPFDGPGLSGHLTPDGDHIPH